MYYSSSLAEVEDFYDCAKILDNEEEKKKAEKKK